MSHPHGELHLFSRRARFSAPAGTRAAVSLHSHSEHSRESLAFFPDVLGGLPVVGRLLERGAAAYDREHGRPLNFADWYWRPPLSAAAVVASERTHLERRFDLSALVSL